MEETILLSDKLPNHKVISIRKMNEFNRKQTNDFDQLNDEEQDAALKIEIAKTKQQLSSLQQQKEKMLHDIKEAIQKEKQEWLEIKEVEREQAKEVGYKVGYDVGQEKAVQEYNDLIKKANEIVHTATNDYHRTIEQHQEAIVQLAITVAEKIITDKITDDPSKFTAIVVKAIEELKDKSNISIYLHPNNYQFVSRQKEELEQIVEDGEKISLYIDQNLQEGDCLIKHPFGQIDVGIDLQLQQIKNALEEKLTEN